MEGYRKISTFRQEHENTIVYYNSDDSSYAIPLENAIEPSKTLQGRAWIDIQTVRDKQCLIIHISKMWTRVDRNEYMKHILVPMGLDKEYEVITFH